MFRKLTLVPYFFANIGAVDLNSELPAYLELILKKNSAIIDTISLNFPVISISFHRGGNYQSQDKLGVFDEIVFRKNQGTINNEIVIEIVATINRKLKAFDAKRSVSGTTESKLNLLQFIIQVSND